MYTAEKPKIEITNVEDLKDIANEFDILYYQEMLEKRREKESQYELNKALIKADLENLKNEIIDRDNLRKLREILEFIERHDPNYYLEIDRSLYRDVIVEILNNFHDDLSSPNNSLIEYNLIRDALKFVTYMEESAAYSKFFEIYNTQRNLKGKLKDHEMMALGKLNNIVKQKQKKRKAEITRKKKYLTEEMARELSKTNLPKINNLLENDFYHKKEEDLVKKVNNCEMILNEDNKTANAWKKVGGAVKQEVKEEPPAQKSKNSSEMEQENTKENAINSGQGGWNQVLNENLGHTVSESEMTEEKKSVSANKNIENSEEKSV